MEPVDKQALIHMLVAQREQITATLLLLTKDEPAPPADVVPRRKERPVFGQPRTGG